MSPFMVGCSCVVTDASVSAMDCGPPRVPSWPPELISSDPRGESTNEVRPGPTAPVFVESESLIHNLQFH